MLESDFVKILSASSLDQLVELLKIYESQGCESQVKFIQMFQQSWNSTFSSLEEI